MSHRTYFYLLVSLAAVNTMVFTVLWVSTGVGWWIFGIAAGVALATYLAWYFPIEVTIEDEQDALDSEREPLVHSFVPETKGCTCGWMPVHEGRTDFRIAEIVWIGHLRNDVFGGTHLREQMVIVPDGNYAAWLDGSIVHPAGEVPGLDGVNLITTPYAPKDQILIGSGSIVDNMWLAYRTRKDQS